MARQIVRNNSTMQNLSDASIHHWYRFVLAYPDHLVAEILDSFGAHPGQRVLDPFAGTGTTLVECKKRGIDSTGIDANPVTAFASRVKTTWDLDLTELRKRRNALISYLREADQRNGKHGTGQLSLDDLTLDNAYSAYDFPPMVEPLIDTAALQALIPAGAISELPLRKVLFAQQTLDALPDDAITDLIRLALASVAVSDLSNLGFGPEVYVKRQKRLDADLCGPLARKLERIEGDLTAVRRLPSAGQATVTTGDARQLTGLISDPVDFVITSPPYPNEKDYTRTTRLELVLLGFIKDRDDLRNVKEGMLRSHTRNIFKADDDSQFVADIPEIVSLAQTIERKRVERGATSGFERLYHRVVTEYFGGMYRVFAELEKVMPPGGKLALVVGDQMSYFQVPIRTAELLSLVACRKLAFREIETRLWRTRLATATRRDVEEHILILERC